MFQLHIFEKPLLVNSLVNIVFIILVCSYRWQCGCDSNFCFIVLLICYLENIIIQFKTNC